MQSLQSYPYPSFPLGRFAPPDKFTTVTVDQILAHDSEARRAVSGHIVLIGGDWHTRAYQRGPLVDQYDSPVGEIPAVFLHGNYVATLLDRSLFGALPDWLARLIEVLAAAAVAIVFALNLRLIYKCCLTLAIAVAIFGVAYVLLQNLGAEFDFVTPTIAVIVHSGGERLYEWRRDALAFQRLQKGAA